MNDLRQALDDYLAMRRSLGFKLARAGRLLAQFVAYLQEAGAHVVTTQASAAWACLPANAQPSWWAQRLCIVRGFATYLHTLDPTHEVPPAHLLVDPPHRATPYLYPAEEIEALMAATAMLRTPLRRATYRTLIGLLAATGMRVGEAIALDRGDIDWAAGVLVVRATKFNKSRLIPLHETTVQALRNYERLRLQLAGSSDASLFVSTVGARLLYCNANWTFLRLVAMTGLAPRSASCRPRLHDLRHAFAVATLLDWYRDGGDVQARLPRLSTYLGHAHPTKGSQTVFA
jgi:integrase/recombinase XerD